MLLGPLATTALLLLSFAPYVRLAWRDESLHRRARRVPRLEQLLHLACYADSRGDRVMPFEGVTRFLTKILDDKGRLDSVQVTGGEASLPRVSTTSSRGCTPSRASR